MTGRPAVFMCSACRRMKGTPGWNVRRYQATRTGRTRSGHSTSGHGQLHEAHEYKCTCGHVGWSTHPGVLQLEVVDAEDFGS